MQLVNDCFFPWLAGPASVLPLPAFGIDDDTITMNVFDLIARGRIGNESRAIDTVTIKTAGLR